MDTKYGLGYRADFRRKHQYRLYKYVYEIDAEVSNESTRLYFKGINQLWLVPFLWGWGRTDLEHSRCLINFK